MKDEKTFWWKLDVNESHRQIFGSFQCIDDNQSNRRTANQHFLQLYTNRRPFLLDGRITLNVVKSCIDSVIAQIATNRPRPMFLSIKGDYRKKKQAEGLSKFVNGQFYSIKQYIKGLSIFQDAAIYGTGFEKIYDIGGRIYGERVLPDEILVDEREGRYGDPRQMFQHKHVNRDVLMEMYPEHKDSIKKANSIREEMLDMLTDVDQCSVVEAWHLPSASEAKDGRHVICVNEATLLDEDWDRDSFPVVPFRWNPDPASFYGIGLTDEIDPIQAEINIIAQKIQTLMSHATSMVWVSKGSGISSINNKNWAVREYTGRPPIFQTTSSVSGEYFSHLDRLYNKAFEIAGVSQLAAQALKPAGLDSGEALRVYNDIGSKRFQHTGQRWEQFHLDVAEQILETARCITERGDGDIKTLCQGDREVEEIRFKDVAIEKNKYSIRVWPTGLLPDTPSGKIEMIQRLVQAVPSIANHIIPLLVPMPDIESVASLESAPLDIANKMIDNILYEGRMEHPYPEMNLQLTRELATKAILRAHFDGVPIDNIDMLRSFIDQIDALAAMSQPEMPQEGMPPPQEGMPPEGMPPPSGGVDLAEQAQGELPINMDTIQA